MANNHPHKVVEDVVRRLPQRPQDVIIKRFGLVDGVRRTLESIGREEGITRERVRQIEADGFRHLRAKKVEDRLRPYLDRLHKYIAERGHVVRESQIFRDLGHEFEPRFTGNEEYHPTIYFLLSYGEPFTRVSESPKFHAAWAIDRGRHEKAQLALEKLVKDLEAKKYPHTEEELTASLRTVCTEVFGESVPTEACRAYIGISRDILKSPFGHYGLRQWAEINPRGVRDKAYLVLQRAAKPLHFREVTEEINKTGFAKRTAHPQTVHNELIKDPRFILVGRGKYALRDWGYEPGTVRDVLIRILKDAPRPLTRDEVIAKVLEQRFVKPNTVVLNLQNKNYFRRDEGGRYTVRV